MINRCKYINIILTICSQINRVCPYMADPLSCPDYDEGANRPYHTPSTENVESLTEFADRIEGELNGMGIKVVKSEEVIEEVPDWF